MSCFTGCCGGACYEKENVIFLKGYNKFSEQSVKNNTSHNNIILQGENDSQSMTMCIEELLNILFCFTFGEKKPLNQAVSNPQKFINIIKQSTGKTNEDDITIKDIMQVLEKNCFSLDENTDVLLDVLKNGYIDKNDNDKRKFLNRYQVSLLLYYNKNLAKKIIDQKLSIIYNNNDPVEVILVDPENIQDDNNEINSNNTDNINKQNESLELFLQNSNITDKNDIKICNKTPGLFQLNKILFLNETFNPNVGKEDFFFDFFIDIFCDPNDFVPKDITIINNNTVACSCMDYPIDRTHHIAAPVFKCTSGYNAENSLKILNKITKTLSNIKNEDNNIDNNDINNNKKVEKGLSFIASSAGITNMIYELEKFEKTYESNNDQIYIDRINIINIPLWAPFITMSSAETADRLIAVIKKLKAKGFIKDRLTITLTSPDFMSVHPLCSSKDFLTNLYNKINEDNNNAKLNIKIEVINEKNNEINEENNKNNTDLKIKIDVVRHNLNSCFYNSQINSKQFASYQALHNLNNSLFEKKL